MVRNHMSITESIRKKETGRKVKKLPSTSPGIGFSIEKLTNEWKGSLWPIASGTSGYRGFCLTGMIIMQGFCRGEVIRHRIMSGFRNHVSRPRGGGG